MIVTIPFYLASTAVYLAYLIKQNDRMQKIGYYALLAGFVWHSATLARVPIETGTLAVDTLQQTLSIAGWAIAGVFVVFRYRFKVKMLGIFAAPLVAGIMIIATCLPSDGTVSQAGNLFASLWLASHVIVIFMGEASFALACGIGLMYLLQENAIKTKHHGFFFKRLPALESLDTAGYACIAVGFTMLTVGLITGFVYAKSVWGGFWRWDPKEVWSGIAWLLYAALLHGRLSLGWRGRKAAIMSIIGFAILLFTFLGVNLLLEGHHGEFTRI